MAQCGSNSNATKHVVVDSLPAYVSKEQFLQKLRYIRSNKGKVQKMILGLIFWRKTQGNWHYPILFLSNFNWIICYYSCICVYIYRNGKPKARRHAKDVDACGTDEGNDGYSTNSWHQCSNCSIISAINITTTD